MIGLSSIYFGCRKLGLYESIDRINELDFDLVELRQEHYTYGNMLPVLKKARGDFPNLVFTIHAPLCSGNGITIRNSAMGLTAKNRKVLEHTFKGAEVLGARNVIFHVGFQELVFFNHVAWLPRVHWPRLKMSHHTAMKRSKQFFGRALELGKNIGAEVLVENPAISTLASMAKSRQDFEKLFEEIPELGLCLDMSHSFARNEFKEFIGFGKKIREVHVAYTDCKEDLHLPISKENLHPLRNLPKLKKIPLVLEHSTISLAEIMKEKKLVENFLKTV